MKLKIDALDSADDADALHVVDLVKDLEQRIGELYSVHPVQSTGAYEEFEDGSRITHSVFGYVAKGSEKDLPLVRNMLLALWGDLRRTEGVRGRRLALKLRGARAAFPGYHFRLYGPRARG